MIKNFVDKIADRIRMGYLAAFLLLLISYILTFTSTQKLIEQARVVTHTNEVIHDLDNVIEAITKSESAFRGYVITNNKKLLDDYYESRVYADSTFERVKKITENNPSQQARLKSLRAMMDEKILWINSDISLFDSTHQISKNFFESSDEAVRRMIKLETEVHAMERQERELLNVKSGNVAKYSSTIKIINIISIILAILLTIYSIVTFNKENMAKLTADRQAADFRKQLEQRFEELSKLNIELIELRNIEKFAVTGRISRTIAHEVRNPLTNINLAVEHLRSEVTESEEISMLFEMIMRNTDRINQLISNLLNSTRTSELKLVKASINDVLDKSLEFAGDRIELKKIKVIKKYDPEICHVLVNNEKIYIAFLNIIVNAIEAMEEHGTLILSTENLNNRCVAKISDTGSGMNKADVDKLFEPYFTTKENGHGLGLTNTQNIILSHNAKITAESTPGEGTTFTLTFDFASED
ncbi:MAG: CHASE3 domain-containing protein [Bacteroidota bacterium]|nr:CHASE3 domain-containing protein [Bacteroidota bacterium]